ncbi:MAG: hypothetical protein ACFFD5_10015 [Candidatus Thorarchaeota archaeon]
MSFLFNNIIQLILISTFVSNTLKSEITNLGNRQKIVNIFTLLAIPLFILGLVVSLIFATFLGNYRLHINPISELGSILVTPYPFIMNGTFVLSSFFLSFYFFNLYKVVIKYSQYSKFYKNIANLGFLLILIMIISLIFAGMITVDMSRGLHNLCTVFVFVPLIFGEFIIGVLILKLKIFKKYISILMAFGHLIVSLLYFFVHTPMLEWMMFVILLSWGMPLSIEMIKNNNYVQNP